MYAKRVCKVMLLQEGIGAFSGGGQVNESHVESPSKHSNLSGMEHTWVAVLVLDGCRQGEVDKVGGYTGKYQACLLHLPTPLSCRNIQSLSKAHSLSQT